ncbi:MULTISPECIES: diguanylate cyclase [Vibrio]|nr:MULTISPECIES: diguanylate cyclase [Vibrio]
MTDRFVDEQIQQAKSSIQHDLALVRYSIEANIYRDAYLADSFSTLVALNPEFAKKNWNSLAEQFLSKSSFVRNIGLAPNDVISYMYPIKGNEKAIGLDFRTVPEQYKTVQLAKESKKVFIAGPLDLVQGGRGIIARYPIFTDLPHMNDYWGTLSVVINYEALINASKLHTLKGAQIALVANDNNNTNGRLIEGEQSVLTEPDLDYPIYLPNKSWRLYAKYGDFDEVKSVSTFKSLFISFGVISFSIGYILLLFILNNYLKVQKLSLHDELTHLPNRRYLLNTMNQVMSKSGSAVQFSVLNIDLNSFKKINDSFGHDAGDQVLKHVAAALTHCLRASDFISRIGGDEFVVILFRTNKNSDIEKIIEKIHLYLQSNPLPWKEEYIQITVSIGYYSFIGEADPFLIDTILSSADKSMYEQKARFKHQSSE